MAPNDRHRPGAQSSKSNWRLPVFNFKNKLQEHAQKNRMGLPVYNTVNEGVQHDPKFRSTVRVRNRPYRSSRTFNQKKKAEQDAARVALESLCPAPVRKVIEYPYPVVHEDAPFCKSILSQFAIDMHLDAPIYKTNQVERSLEVPVFVSSVHLNGFNFTGAKAKNKKEAEQLAARVMVLFFLERCDFESAGVISEVTMSKFDHYAAVGNTWDTSSIFSKARSIVNSRLGLYADSLPGDTLQKQADDALPNDSVQKHAADALPDDIVQKQADDALSVQKQAADALPNDGVQKQAMLPDDIVQKQAADALPDDIVQKQAMLPDDIVQKQAADALPDDIVQKQAADSLPDDIVQKQAADALPDDIVQKQGADPLPDDIVQNQAANPIPNDIVQKQAADPLLRPCKKARLESRTQIDAPDIEFVPSEYVQTFVPPLSESDQEKADAVVALTEATPSVSR